MPPRFYSSTALPRANYPQAFGLDAEAAQHVRVLRLNVGDSVVLFDGNETLPVGEATAVITAIEKKSVSVEVTSWQPTRTESALAVTLIQSLAVGDKMDWIVQKATELGVTALVPIRSARSTLKLDPERAEKRVAHWRSVAIAACEQCGRNRIPSVAPVQSLHEALSAPGTAAILHPLATESLTAWARGNPGQSLRVVIGPEGGFSEEELALAVQLGATPVTLGPRVLRTETAGLAAIAALQVMLGDLG
jgi:16S rRNA (uracil1498-N3)-methyltransferase